MLLPNSKVFSKADFQLEKGGVLPTLELAYETWGKLDDTGSNAVLLCHGYTNTPHAAGDAKGWWHNLIRSGGAIDTDRYFVICINMIGSSYGSTSPASMNPQTGEPYGSSFPEITPRDMIESQRLLLDHLGIGKLCAVIGYSYGGQLAFLWGVTYPDRMKAIVPVATGMRSWSTPDHLRALKERFEKCSCWNGGNYYASDKDEITAELVKTRTETLTNYGVKRMLEDTVGVDQAEKEVAERASSWAREFDANSLIVLREANIGFDVTESLNAISCPVLYVLSRTDTVFPPDLAKEADHLFGQSDVESEIFIMESAYGHNAPSSDWKLWEECLRVFLNQNAAI